MNEYLQSELNETVDREGFVIDSLDKLNWAFRKIAAYKAKSQEIKDLAAAEYKRIKEWEEKELKKYDDSLSYFEYLIQEYHYKQLELDDKAKTISTPYGKTKSVTRKATPKVKDVQALIEHVKDNIGNEFIKTELKLDWTSVKGKLEIIETHEGLTVIDENGMLVPGVEIEPSKTTFKVEV